MVKKFEDLRDADFHHNEAIEWFVLANAQETRQEWKTAFQEGLKHTEAASQLGIPTKDKNSLERAKQTSEAIGAQLWLSSNTGDANASRAVTPEVGGALAPPTILLGRTAGSASCSRS